MGYGFKSFNLITIMRTSGGVLDIIWCDIRSPLGRSRADAVTPTLIPPRKNVMGNRLIDTLGYKTQTANKPAPELTVSKPAVLTSANVLTGANVCPTCGRKFPVTPEARRKSQRELMRERRAAKRGKA